mmetsp:Transcript_47639/g.153194  ORF Transcript_47639/g.153194 Transcript_47639/m.153194 type:complete len:233 (+) Transcript_47639:5238-5936(+)
MSFSCISAFSLPSVQRPPPSAAFSPKCSPSKAATSRTLRRSRSTSKKALRTSGASASGGTPRRVQRARSSSNLRHRGAAQTFGFLITKPLIHRVSYQRSFGAAPASPRRRPSEEDEDADQVPPVSDSTGTSSKIRSEAGSQATCLKSGGLLRLRAEPRNSSPSRLMATDAATAVLKTKTASARTWSRMHPEQGATSEKLSTSCSVAATMAPLMNLTKAPSSTSTGTWLTSTR